MSKAIELLEKQQKEVKEYSAPWMVAEQLKEICTREPESAELVAQDLENPEMSIVAAEKKIKAYADKHKTGNFACVTPAAAEQILREFYGLPAQGKRPAWEEPKQAAGAVSLSLEDFLG